MDAVITAGGRIDKEFAQKTGVTVKALLEVDGEPVISRIIHALESLPDVERIFVVGPDVLRDHLTAHPGVELLPETDSGAANFISGLERCSSGEGCRAIFAASDLPFVTAEAIQSYLGMCPVEADFCYPIVADKQFLAAYPGSPVKFARLRDGSFTGGCVFIVKPQAILANRGLIDRIFSSRKSLFKMASILGWKFIWGLVTHAATVESCARRGSQIIGCDCRVVTNAPAELAYDLDDWEDYEYALRIRRPSSAR